MKEKVTILVGNGFNYFINGYIKSHQFSDDIIKNWKETSNSKDLQKTDARVYGEIIKELSKTMSVYCELLNFIELEDYETKGETLLSSLEEFIEKFDKESDNPTNNFLHIECSIKESIKDQFERNAKAIDESKRGFLQHVHAQVKFAFKNNRKYFAENLMNVFNKTIDVSKYTIYTTNYDYITESVFTECYGKNHKVEGISFYHLHGHYKDDEKGEIICCSPNHKKTRIQENHINNQNYCNFQNDISDSTIIILFGIGLTSDPHLLEELNNKKGATFIIIDNNKDEYFKKHLLNHKTPRNRLFSFLRKNRIYFIDTLNPSFDKYKLMNVIQTPNDLLDSIKDILMDYKKI